MPEIHKEFKITNSYGLHARPAASFVKIASQFACDIQVEKEGVKVAGKSIMGLLTIEGNQGSTIIVYTNGDDAEEALEALGDLIENNFGETEEDE